MDENFLKLANAAYAAIDYFPEADPLKNKSKEKVLEVMDLFAKNQPEKMSVGIDVLLGYLKIGQLQGWLNGANYFILANEFEKMKKAPVLVKEQPKPVVKKEPAVKHENLSDRQKKILVYLKKKSKAQVMDLQTVLAGVTKRTIRRDLDDLLKNNMVMRMGQWNQVFYKIAG